MKRDEGRLLHAGDAYFHQSLVRAGRHDYRLLRFFEAQVHMDLQAAKETVKGSKPPR